MKCTNSLATDFAITMSEHSEEKAASKLEETKEEHSEKNTILVWFLEHTSLLRGSEVARLFCLNKSVQKIDTESFWRRVAKRTYPMNPSVAVIVKGKANWKHYYKQCYDIFGVDGEFNFVNIVGIARDIRAWMKEHTPRIHDTLNDGVDVSNLSRFLKERHFKNRGHLALWTEINGQKVFQPLSRRVQAEQMDCGFFGGFDFYNKKGNLRLLSVNTIFELDKEVRTNAKAFPFYKDLAHFIAFGGRSAFHSVQTTCVLMRNESLMKISLQRLWSTYSQGGGGFLGFMKWYRDSLYKNEFLIEQTGAINRMPRHDPGGSVTVTRGLRIQVRSLYVPEVCPTPSEVTHTYQFELDCAPGQSPPEGVLESRHFEIGEDGNIQNVEGPGVIGLYPRIGPGMKVFRYNSCTRFKKRSRDCWMQGSFLFRLAGGGELRANINRFTFNWRTSPAV